MHSRVTHTLVYNIKSGSIGKSLRLYTKKSKDSPKPQDLHNKASSQEKDCNICGDIHKSCGSYTQVVEQHEQKIPACMPFTDNVPLQKVAPEHCIPPGGCQADCRHPKKRLGANRCPPYPKSSVTTECKSVGHCENKEEHKNIKDDGT